MAGGAAVRKFTTFDETWPILQEEAINKLIANLEIEGLPQNKYFTIAESLRFYTLVYDVACSKRTSEVDKLYDQYKKTFDDYVSSKVLPSLRGKENENLLRELLRQWNNHKTMTKWLSKFFYYLSRYYISRRRLPSLLHASNLAFYNRVFGEIKDQISGAIVSLVDREREGEQIDQNVVKQVLNIFEEIGEESLRKYARDIEEALVNVKPPYYSRTGLNNWKAEWSKSYQDKIKECFEKEQMQVSENLWFTSKDKVLEAYREIKDQVCDAVLSSIDRELDGEQTKHAVLEQARLHVGEQSKRALLKQTRLRAGEQSKRALLEQARLLVGEQSKQALLKQVRNIFEKIGNDATKIYAKDVEEALVEATAYFYSKKSIDWIATKSYDDYMLKVEECLEKEKSRVSEYLKLIINENKLLEVVQHELLDVHANKLEEKRAASRFRRSKL